MEIEKCRKEFENYLMEDFKKTYIFAIDGILDRTADVKGILREYKDQYTELMWRAFKHAWFYTEGEK